MNGQESLDVFGDEPQADQAAPSATEPEERLVRADLDSSQGTLFTPDAVSTMSSSGKLARRFMVPPFSVLNAAQGPWQERKQDWLALGIEGELGRSAKSYNTGEWVKEKGLSGTAGYLSGVSIFDPVLCELAYMWFCPPGGLVLDPFAGGSVRGIVAAKLGRRYVGIDLSLPQIEANYQQAAETLTIEPRPVWIHGDSRRMPALLDGEAADFVFTCPPYYDLERYSDDSRDLSAAGTYAEFLVGYQRIMSHALRRLQEHRFAVVVIGDIRGKHGEIVPLVSDTVAACEAAGVYLYNDIVLINAVGSLAIRVSKQFDGSRKVGRMHQRVLVFCKGDPKIATSAMKHSGG